MTAMFCLKYKGYEPIEATLLKALQEVKLINMEYYQDDCHHQKMYNWHSLHISWWTIVSIDLEKNMRFTCSLWHLNCTTRKESHLKIQSNTRNITHFSVYSMSLNRTQIQYPNRIYRPRADLVIELTHVRKWIRCQFTNCTISIIKASQQTICYIFL